MNTISMKISGLVFGFLLAILILILAILNVGLNANTYKEAQVELDVASYVGTDQGTLDTITINLIDYIKGDRETLNMTGNVYGLETEIFNTKEKLHMVDVKGLFTLANKVIYSLIFLCLLLFMVSVIKNRQGFIYKFFKAASWGMIGIFVLGFFIGLYAFIDFHAFWLSFHKVFFSNDLFLLNPNTDLLIRMMPLDFFINLVSKVGIYFSIMYGTTFASLIVSHYILKKRS